MPDFRWRPLPGRFGVSINESSWNNFGIATTVTASATTVMMMPMFFKRPAGTTGASDVTLTNTFDLTQAATNKRVDIPLLATLTEAQRTFAGEIDFSTGATAGGDLLIVKWVAAGTVTAQPVLTIQAELFNLI